MNSKIIIAWLLALVMMLGLCACGDKTPDTTEPEQPTTDVSLPDDANNQTAFLGRDLYITHVGNYTGAYMEDGSDEVVSDVLMIILKNEGDMPLQLARITLEYADFTANFEATNVPAGEMVVLLEKNRHEYVSDNFYGAAATDVVFFQKDMSLQEDKLKITGANGSLTVENLTNEEMGEIYIYYKNSASDGLFYGGITYRTRVAAGLKPGKSTTVTTGHYYANACTILDVQIVPVE